MVVYRSQFTVDGLFIPIMPSVQAQFSLRYRCGLLEYGSPRR